MPQAGDAAGTGDAGSPNGSTGDGSAEAGPAGVRAAGVGPAHAGRERWKQAGSLGLVGPRRRRRNEAGGLGFGFVAGERHADLAGVVQGDMPMTPADRGLGMMATEAAGTRPVVTVGFDRVFARAARIGRSVETAGEIVRRTDGLVFLRGHVSSGGTVVATCRGTWKTLSRRLGPPAAEPRSDRRGCDGA